MVRATLLVILLGLGAGLRAASVPTFAPANLVVGQPDFLSGNLAPVVGAATLDQPAGLAVHAATGKVFLADTANNRVLRYANAAALANGAAAERVFGQGDFTTNGSASPPTAASLDSPTGIWVEPGGQLWVADTDNHRILLFLDALADGANGPAATLVLGQPGFDAETASPASQTSLNAPLGLCVDPAGQLWVADSGNNRVLSFGSPSQPAAQLPAAPGVGIAAAGKLGQSGFTDSAGGSSNTQLLDPAAVTMDATGTLWVADQGNHRVVGFASAAVISNNNNASNASRLLGQPDFNNGSSSPGVSAARMNAPSGVFADAANNLWVLDQGNHRALRFAGLDAARNGDPARSVVGQPNFAESAPGLSDRRVDSPLLGIFAEPGGALWLTDRNHHRALRFASQDDAAPTIRIKGRRKLTTTHAQLVVSGIAGDDVGVTRVTVQAGRKAAKKAAGTTAWRRRIALAPGRNVVRALAFDAAGKRSAPARVVITRK